MCAYIKQAAVSFISQPPRIETLFFHCWKMPDVSIVLEQMVLLAKSDAQDPSAPAANVICVKNAFGPSTFPSFRESGRARPAKL